MSGDFTFGLNAAAMRIMFSRLRAAAGNNSTVQGQQLFDQALWSHPDVPAMDMELAAWYPEADAS